MLTGFGMLGLFALGYVIGSYRWRRLVEYAIWLNRDLIQRIDRERRLHGKA